MSVPSATPVVVLAFANDNDAHLNMLQRERKNIFEKLQRHHDAGYIQVHKEENTAIADIFKLFNRYADRIAIFHYGGHANGTCLQLETSSGEAELADATGLAQLLGQQKTLQLVFLNGCATRDQVKQLFARGVRAVIATAVPINDEVATAFAEQFYDALANRAPIQKAFQTAQAFVTTCYGQDKKISEFRDIPEEGAQDVGPTTGVTWGLYINPANGEGALAWKLPEVSERQVQVNIRGAAFSAKASAPVNAVLTKVLVEAILERGGKFSEQAISEEGDQDEGYIRRDISDFFPAPVGEQLRKLFAVDDIDVPRLQQLVIAYETTVKLFCFAMLSQLWNARHDAPSLILNHEDLADLNSFFALSGEGEPTFDYLKLVTAVGRIFQQNEIAPFVGEFTRLTEMLMEEAFSQSYRFMEQMRAELRQNKVSATEIESFCVQTEKHLGTIMSGFTFLGKYKLSTIKRIDFIKERHKEPIYRHRMFLLDRVNGPTLDKDRDLSTFTDSGSVLLIKSLKDVKDYLNLSPFVIDENAFTGSAKSKLFLYSHYDVANDSYHFRFVNDPEHALKISGDPYPWIKTQFEDFKKEMSAQ